LTSACVLCVVAVDFGSNQQLEILVKSQASI
jgi:hypothetical protein